MDELSRFEREMLERRKLSREYDEMMKRREAKAFIAIMVNIIVLVTTISMSFFKNTLPLWENILLSIAAIWSIVVLAKWYNAK